MLMAQQSAMSVCVCVSENLSAQPAPPILQSRVALLFSLLSPWVASHHKYNYPDFSALQLVDKVTYTCF